MRSQLDPPAIVCEDLVSLARGINAEHAASRRDARSSLEHARACGEMLLRAKKACMHGEWMGWVALRVHFSNSTARAYMQVARNWAELPETGNLTLDGALYFLSAPEEGAELPMPEERPLLSDVEEAEEAIAATIANLSPEDALAVIGRTEERIERQAIAVAALAPAEEELKLLGLAAARLGVALKYLRRLSGTKWAAEIADMEHFLKRAQEALKNGSA